jgi:hypothetical protein
MDPVAFTHLLRVYCYAADLVEHHTDTLLFALKSLNGNGCK